MRRSRKPLRASGSVEGSNPSPSAPPVDLPHDLGLYFEFPPGTRIVPVRDLYPMKPPDSQPASVAVALARMANASGGRISRRAPLRVRLRSDGCFDVVDGNAPYAAARELGWPELPVLVEPAYERPFRRVLNGRRFCYVDPDDDFYHQLASSLLPAAELGEERRDIRLAPRDGLVVQSLRWPER